MDVDDFTHRLHDLTAEEIQRVAAAVRAELGTAEGELAWWRATIDVTGVLRHQRRSRQAGLAAHRAASAVVEAARIAGLADDTSRDEVTVVARAAAEAARLLVAHGPMAAHAGEPLFHPWQQTHIAALHVAA